MIKQRGRPAIKKPQILELFKQGKTYDEIVAIVKSRYPYVVSTIRNSIK